MICLEAVILLKVNLGKSEVVSVGTIRNMATLAEILSCIIGSLPMTYLGMLLVADFKVKYVWSPILDKMEMERRFSGWKKLYLSKGGKLTFLKSMLSFFRPTIYLSLLFPFMWQICWRKYKEISCGSYK